MREHHFQDFSNRPVFGHPRTSIGNQNLGYAVRVSWEIEIVIFIWYVESDRSGITSNGIMSSIISHIYIYIYIYIYIHTGRGNELCVCGEERKGGGRGVERERERAGDLSFSMSSKYEN